ncbi:MAG: pentapeptide repeat-containing protein [Ignavibacteria bacterium]|nr:pentapeptide repeat-containing protein [Ignavibacteria bacterium]
MNTTHHTKGNDMSAPMILPSITDSAFPVWILSMTFDGVVLRNMAVGRVKYQRCTFCGCDFTDSLHNTVRYEGADLRNTRWVGVTLIDCEFANCDLRGASFDPLQIDVRSKHSLLNDGNILDEDVRFYLTILGTVEDDTEDFLE